MTTSTPVQTSVQLRSVNHIGIPVRDLDRSIAFYQKLTGVLPLFVSPMQSDAVARGVGVPGARLRFALIRIDNLSLELIEYETPRGRDFELGNNDVGSLHISFQVEDIGAAYEALEAQGIAFLAPPHTFTEADGAPPVVGVKFCYFTDPDGIHLELNQPAGGSA